jgi:ankyrin repeat protein
MLTESLHQFIEEILKYGRYAMLLYSYKFISSTADKRRIARIAIYTFVDTKPQIHLYKIMSHVRCFKFLLNMDLGVDIINKLFVYASDIDNIHFIKTMLKYKPDINTNNGEALVRSCRMGNIDIVRLLLDRGITRSTRPNVLTMVTVQNNVKLFKLCVDCGVEVTDEVRSLIRSEDLTKLYYLVGLKSNIRCVIS